MFIQPIICKDASGSFKIVEFCNFTKILLEADIDISMQESCETKQKKKSELGWLLSFFLLGQLLGLSPCWTTLGLSFR